MSHLHIPDGVLPPALWVPGAVLALLVLLATARAAAADGARGVGFRGALGALMLAVMSIPIPLFALEYCLTLGGPVGVLLGPAAGFQVSVVVCVILAFLGQGGFTVVGLNAVVLGAGVATARPVYALVVPRLGAPRALAAATLATQLVSGALWFALLGLALRLDPGLRLEAHHHQRALAFGGLALGLWVLAMFAEAAVAFGMGRFLARVRPDLLPGAEAPR